MIDPVVLFADGGPFMPLVAGFGMLGGVLACLVVLVVGGLKLRVPASAGWVLLTLTAVLGLLGTGMGVSMAEQAVQNASPEMRPLILANGISVALFVQTAWLLFVSLSFVVVAWLASLPALLAPGPGAQVSFESLGGAVLGAVAGTLVAAVLLFGTVGLDGMRDAGPVSFLIPPLAVLTMFAMFLGTLRNSAEPVHMGRIGGTRVMMGTAALLGIGLFGELFNIQGVMLAFMAVANAAASDKAKLLGYGLEVAAYARWIGWSFALIPAFTAWGAAAPLVGDFDVRQLVGGLLGGLQAVVILGCIALSGWLTSGAIEAILK
jgi:hypothetical protein